MSAFQSDVKSKDDDSEPDTEIEDVVAQPAHWFAPGGLGDPDGDLQDTSVDGLQEAALRGDICLVRKYIMAEAPVNAPLHVAGGDEYLTLLHVIASIPGLPNGLHIVAELIQAQANPNARSTLGSTPLMFACFHKNVGLAEVLLESEADPEAVDDHGKTALRYAVSLERKGTDAAQRSAELAILQDNGDAVTRLLELGAMSDGLVYAVAEKSLHVIKELMSGGANPFARNEAGLSCWEVALERDNEVGLAI
eukprot:g25448.t1